MDEFPLDGVYADNTGLGKCSDFNLFEVFGRDNLRDLFTRISTHPNHRLDELLPDKWLMAQGNASGAYEET